MAKYSYLLLDRKNGNMYGNHFEDDSDDNVMWDWSNGNNSCDCNRMLKMYGRHNYPCNSGDNRVIVLNITNEDTNTIIYQEERK